MPKTFKGPNSLVLACVKPGEFSTSSLKAAVSLCKRTGMRLRLVSAVEPALMYLQFPAIEMYDFTAISRAESNELKAQVEDELKQFAQSLELDSKVETSVVVGQPAQVALSDAVANGVSLIVTGAANGSHRFVPKGLSTALSLMADSHMPVLVVKENGALDFSKEALNIVVADDLSANCERAVLAAFDLAIALGDTDVHHIYSNSLTMQNFARNVQKLRELHDDDSATDISPTDLWEKTRINLHERLRLRAPGRSLFLEAAGGHYWPEIRDGSVELALEKVIESASPELIVFGRHHSFHRRPFAIGRVPFHFMMSMDRPILVVPPN
jgi:nucleotide-binding universal stress UspA family protein